MVLLNTYVKSNDGKYCKIYIIDKLYKKHYYFPHHKFTKMFLELYVTSCNFLKKSSYKLHIKGELAFVLHHILKPSYYNDLLTNFQGCSK